MSGITEKSTILQWLRENIDSASNNKGVYILRNIPTLNGIVYISYSENIKQSLLEDFESENFPDVEWFDWYEVDTKENGLEICKMWLEKYLPKFLLY